MTASPDGLWAAPDASAQLPRLPRGPHRLSRHEVEQSQRERLLVGAAEAVAAKGYAATSVADILERAGVSRTSFYQLFDDKLACFVAAYRMAAEVVAAVMAAELAQVEGDAELTPLDKLDRLLGSYLRTLAANPVLARVFLVEVYAAGAPAIEQRRQSLEQFVDLVVAAHGDAPGRLIGADPEQRFAVEVLVGAVSSMVTNAVGVGETENLPALHQPLMRLAGRILGEGDPQTRRIPPGPGSASTER